MVSDFAHGGDGFLGLEAEPYAYVRAQLFDYITWDQAPEGWETTQRTVTNSRAHPNRMGTNELFLRRLDEPGLVFRYGSELCGTGGSPGPTPEGPSLVFEMPEDVPHVAMHQTGGYISAQELIDRYSANARPGVRIVWLELGTSEQIMAAHGLEDLPSLSADPGQVLWVVVQALGDNWGPHREGHEYGSYSVVDAVSGGGEGSSWGCCIDLAFAGY
jgi:hypothetical protein